jgi:hypothetical protein
MKYQRTILLFALCTAISACNMPDTTMANGGITLNDNVVTLHVKGSPDAIIDSSGDLHIDDKTVSTTPSQRGLLMLYYQSVNDVRDTGKEMGAVGAKMGTKAIQNSLASKSDADQKKDAEAGGQQLKQLGQKMCQDQANIKTVQDQLTTQLAEFKPYGSILTKESVENCLEDDKD